MSNSITEDSLGKLSRIIARASRTAILAHAHPDGDAIGSVTALCAYLKGLGKDAVIILPDTPGPSLSFMARPGLKYIFADVSFDKAIKRIRESDTIFLLDCNDFSRTESLQEYLKASSATKVLIDHHLDPRREDFSLVFSEIEVSSAAELLYRILKGLAGGTANLPQETLYALMCGMTTDTNNFANSTYPSTFSMAADLIANGVDRDSILRNIYNEYRENRIRLMGYMQYKNMVITPEGGAYMIMSRQVQSDFDHREAETDGLVNVPLAIGKVRISVLLTEKDGMFRVSVRSKKGFSARDLAAKYFHGGGHENASGGKLFIGEDIPDVSHAGEYVEKALKDILG